MQEKVDCREEAGLKGKSCRKEDYGGKLQTQAGLQGGGSGCREGAGLREEGGASERGRGFRKGQGL